MSLRWHLVVRIGAAVITALALAGPRPAWACTCAMPAGPDVAFSQATAVFTGTVTGISRRNALSVFDRLRQWMSQWTGQSLQLGLADPVKVTFAVTAAWKGAATTPIVVGTGYGGGDCGYGFAAGQAYLVYAYGLASGNGLVTHICSRTAEVQQATQDLAYLQTRPALTVTPAPIAVPWLAVGAGACGLGLLALAAATFTLFRRRARANSA